MGDLLGSLGAADDRAEAVGGDPGDLEIAQAEGAGCLADHEQHAPRFMGSRDGDRQFGASVLPDGQRRVIGVVGQQQTGQRCSAGAFTSAGEVEGAAEDAEPGREVDRAKRPGEIHAGDGAGREAIAASLPYDDEMVAIGVADRPHRCLEHVVGIVIRVDQAAEHRRDGQVEVMALSVERVGPRRFELTASGPREPCRRCRIDRPPAAPRPGRGGRTLGGAGLGGRQEALQVAQSIASVAPWIDPVVAQPARIAPGPDRVRVYAEQPGGLGHRQGGIHGSGRQGDRHDSLRKCEVGAKSLPISQFLPIGRRY